MENKVNSVKDLYHIVLERWSQLDNIRSRYLSEDGLAAKEAYRAVLWHLGFHEDFQTLSEDEAFMNLVNIPDKNPEYYKILRSVNRVIEKNLTKYNSKEK